MGMPLPSRCHVVASAVFTAVAKASKVVLPCNINGKLTILPDSLTSWESAGSSFKAMSVAENNWTMIPSNVIS
ncbi:uncharacterized protein F5891DRAFT_65906 [Suillus fuscotomentosus]|uniref:Uncharacterized protein n=1 Tax=Suillus fuscotomentosus TaxID=1912939 RepID=A0AAD4EDI9_9AGAM|nr:uncharacterized protein F5891DRAFT_65906 [Suillus fuscotomentosus]KAG1904066.1 hypothetical protein F5891DRAFT_65906 [Suillus fuscotomentosus]